MASSREIFTFTFKIQLGEQLVLPCDTTNCSILSVLYLIIDFVDVVELYQPYSLGVVL